MTTIPAFCAIGDCCIDIYDDGQTNLGGTAYNVAIAARRAGAKASIFSAIGSDAIGKQVLSSFQQNNVDTSHLTVVQGKTSSIPIHLSAQGRPRYGRWDLASMKNLHITAADKTFLQSHDVVRAVLFTPIKHLFEEFYSLNLGSTIKVGDFAGSSADSIDVAQIKQYADRLDIMIKSIETNEAQSLALLKSIAENHRCMTVALLGSQGSVVFTKNKTYRQPALRVWTKNTTGAGDVYQAYFLTRYVQYRDIQKAMLQATQAAARAISRSA